MAVMNAWTEMFNAHMHALKCVFSSDNERYVCFTSVNLRAGEKKRTFRGDSLEYHCLH